MALTETLVLTDVQGFRESTPRQPGDAVAHLEPGVLDRRGQPVPRAGTTEGDQVAAGFEYSQALGGPFGAPALKVEHRGW
jgi:hypothetical protein